MNTAVLTVLALLPIITVAVFLVGLRWPASRAMPLSYVVAIGAWRSGCGRFRVCRWPPRHHQRSHSSH